MKKDNILLEKSYKFAIRIVKLYQYLCKEKGEFVLSKQVLRSGTSIGANAEEADGGQSKKDFFAKLNICYKEARETKYWLKLLTETEYLDAKISESLLADCEELLKIIGSSIKTIKSQNNSSLKTPH